MNPLSAVKHEQEIWTEADGRVVDERKYPVSVSGGLEQEMVVVSGHFRQSSGQA